MSKPVISVNVVIVGASAVGKTSLSNQLVNNIFSEDYTSTAGMDLFQDTMEMPDCSVSLTLRDTCGQEQYKSLASQYYRETQGALIVYDITNRDSFDYLQDWIDDVSMYCPQGVKIVLVGNKVDLENDARAVTTAEGQQFASEGGYAFFETSAKLNIKVEEAFRELVTRIVQAEHTNPAQVAQSSQDRVQITTQKSTPEEKKSCC
ncbi:GTP-binding protein yptV2, putative [Entamoeba dispar SAW760]|uniref:GTP-binding protein yptV2, putative n=1 Tax=Entamoeba dispar (strain ATCC PRA-260 / SAW760) TaxID=370354 RepID=B0EFP6_ENTDS|nr:GTP-binding protein yptV2, putative [Entamoeba dispar SAW760]EDR26644.1 GTP-binding protein yptV2, putative [Entamoeba dispar SAW760]|eukprot:EDR26644.1 GTP-binding protein yptV2, putative [Entamoeba dispar SAW760]